MMISCEKAVKICNKAQYKEASFWDLILLKIHKFICRTCQKHSVKNTKLTSLCKEAKLVALTEEEKAEMKNKIIVND